LCAIFLLPCPLEAAASAAVAIQRQPTPGGRAAILDQATDLNLGHLGNFVISDRSKISWTTSKIVQNEVLTSFDRPGDRDLHLRISHDGEGAMRLCLEMTAKTNSSLLSLSERWRPWRWRTKDLLDPQSLISWDQNVIVQVDHCDMNKRIDQNSS